MTGATVPQTTAAAVPYAVNEALKAQGMAPFPATAMSMPRSVYHAVIELAGANVSQMGLGFKTSQLQAELRNRGYTVAGFGFGNGPVAPVAAEAGLMTREATMQVARARASRARLIATIRAKALPIGIATAAVVVIILAVRADKKAR